MKRFVLFILALFILQSKQLLSQDIVGPLSLEACIKLATRYSPELHNARLQAAISNIDLRGAKFAQLPTLGFGVNHGYNFGRSIDRFTNQFVTRSILTDFFSLNASVVLYNGSNLRNTIKQQRYNAAASIKDVAAFQNQLSLNVASAYLSLLMAKELVKSFESQVEATEAQLDRASKMLQAGAVDRGVELALASQLAQEQLSLTEALNQLEMARIGLQNLIVIPPDADWDIITPRMQNDPIVVQHDAEEVFQNALRIMPEIAGGELRVMGAEMMEKAARGLRTPTISLYANMSTVFSENALQITGYNTIGTLPIGFVQNTGELVMRPIEVPTTRVIPLQNQLKDNFGQTLGVSLNWNIFNGMAVQNNIKRSQINMQMQENNLQQNKLALRASVARSVADYKASVAKVNAARKALNASVLQMDFTEKRFENGLINYVEYVNVKNQYTRAQITALQARFEWLFNTVVVDFYNGNPLTIPQS